MIGGFKVAPLTGTNNYVVLLYYKLRKQSDYNLKLLLIKNIIFKYRYSVEDIFL